MNPEYFSRYGGVVPQQMTMLNGFHNDNMALTRGGELLSIVPTDIFGAVSMERRQFAPTGRPITTELAYSQQQYLIALGIGLPHGFYRDEKHQRVLCVDYLLETSLCYLFQVSTQQGYLATKSMAVYDSARHNYPLPPPSQSVSAVMHTTSEEIISGKLKVARINQESDAKWTAAARQCNFGPKGSTAIFPAYAVENHVQVMLHGIANSAYELHFTDGDGVEQILITTLHSHVLAQRYGVGADYIAKIQRDVRSKTGFADIILPDLNHRGDLVTVNALSVSAARRLA